MSTPELLSIKVGYVSVHHAAEEHHSAYRDRCRSLVCCLRLAHAIYGSEKTGEYTHLVRIDRFGDRVWVLTSEGWKERTPVAPTTFGCGNPKTGKDATPPNNPNRRSFLAFAIVK
jgi:hypothetical protein